jgi:uronate dehydrogenase
MKRIAITGAAGLVGTGLRAQLLHRGYRVLSLDIRSIALPMHGEEVAQVDINDQSGLTTLLRGCDAVVHLAACTTDAPWPDQVRLSIEGTINLFEAACAAGVARVIYASSHHVVGLHPRAPHGPMVGTQAQLRPDSRYGVARAFGESAAALYACKYGLRVLAIRIGNVNERPIDRRRLGNWLSWRDLGQLVALGIENPHLMFSVVYGISDATGRHYDNSAAHALGYRPEDSTTAAAFEAGVFQEDPPPAPLSAAACSAGELTLGGQFSDAEFVGGTERLVPLSCHKPSPIHLVPLVGTETVSDPAP